MQDLILCQSVFCRANNCSLVPLYNDDGEYNLDIPENGNTNPHANAAYDDQWEKQNHINGTLFLEVKPFKGFTLKTNNSYEITDGEGRRYWSDKSDVQQIPLPRCKLPIQNTTQINNIKYGSL